jgi:hypothetical protein
MPEEQLAPWEAEETRLARCIGLRRDTRRVWLDLLNGKVVRVTVQRDALDDWARRLASAQTLRVTLRVTRDANSLAIRRVRFVSVSEVSAVRPTPSEFEAVIDNLARKFRESQPDPIGWLREFRRDEEGDRHTSC